MRQRKIMMTMIPKFNPWIKMDRLSQRRVDAATSHNLFWIIDSKGNYGLKIQTDGAFSKETHMIKLKSIHLIKDETQVDQAAFFLILQNLHEWEIFYTLCEDLIKVVLNYPNSSKMIEAVEQRLKRWQQLLQYDKTSSFTIERQMGLFAELCCFVEVIIPKVGVRQALISWNGPEADKQDFLLDDSVLEVKSYRTSKGDAVSISSLKQLYSEKESIYLATFALTASENGQSIEELVNKIRFLIIEQGSSADLELFEAKLISYGYAPELIKEELNSFIVDKQRLFYVAEEFPKITPKDVSDAIILATYSIDLARCEKFEISLDTFLK